MDLLKASRPLLVGIVLMAARSSGGASDRATDIGVIGRTNANASIAAQGRFVGLAWAGRTKDGVTDIYVATSRDGGGTFSAPARVNHVAGEASVSGEQPPRIALVPRSTADPSIVVVWTAKAAAGTRLLSARSDNGGRSFASPVPVPGGDAAGNRGWESIATSSDGHVVALWLDHRELSSGTGAAPMTHAEHQHGASERSPADGVARAQLSKLFLGRVDDPGSSHVVAGGVCYCCKTALATAADGSVYAAWRHVYPGNIRDIAFALSRDGGRTFAPPVRVSDNHWVLDGCPENGPALAVDGHDVVHVVWPTLVNGPTASSESSTLALFYAFSQDGRRFSARQRLPTEGTPRHPQVAISSRGAVVVAWDEQLNGTRRVVVAERIPDNRGAGRFARIPIGIAERGEYPVVAAADTGSVIAWASGPPERSVIRVERLTTHE